MVKNRVVNTTAHSVSEPKGIRYSSFLITINPNKASIDLTTAESQRIAAKLTAFGNWYLQKANLKKSLVFKDRGSLVLSREEHLAKIVQIDPDRVASIEVGALQHRVHLHITFEVAHTTWVQVDPRWVQKRAAHFLGLDPSSVYVNVKASGRSLKDYVLKYAEKAPS